jgi:GH15 family glucan-1,4-alpha-glucosidase
LRTQQNNSGPLHAVRIEDYAMIGDCETAAIVSKYGSIDWLCWPTFSSPACMAALLGTAEAGFWKIGPKDVEREEGKGRMRIRRRYEPGSTILVTTFESKEGALEIIDFMAPRDGTASLLRRVRCLRGRMQVRMDLAIRFDYGRTTPWVTRPLGEDHELRAIAGPDMVVLYTEAPLRGEELRTISEFKLRDGESMDFALTYSSSLSPVPPKPDLDAALASTRAFWSGWADRGRYTGDYQEMVKRSLVTLKALTYHPSGGIVAAPTASLPEKIGGPRNWDYRYCWLRDTSFTLLVLLRAGYEEEAIAWRRWLLRAIAGSPAQLQTVYGLCGERELLEHQADWLPGYEHSKPVLLGNGAVNQFQLDVFGEVATALLRTPQSDDAETKVSASALEAELIDHLCKVWPQPDDGIWETRGGRKHFTHSKVMAWVALDRAIKRYKQFDGGGDVKGWKKNRAMLRREILAKGFNKKMNSFVQSYGSTDLDASLLRLVLVGFLPPDDPRILGTVAAIEKRLLRNGFVLRYDTKVSKDGLAAGEGAFLACSFWLVANYYLIGRKADARNFFERLIGLTNEVGLLSEEYDPNAKRMLGNFPQALSHIALVHAAFTLDGLWKPEPPDDQYGM